jgi:oleandomycin transport system permease protein
MPLSFASNVFVGAGTLPGWMQGFVDVNPLTHLVGAMRGLFLGMPIGNHVWWTLGWCAALVVVFMPLALRAYRRKV